MATAAVTRSLRSVVNGMAFSVVEGLSVVEGTNRTDPAQAFLLHNSTETGFFKC